MSKRYPCPAYRTVRTTAWAAISEDVPPHIYYIEWYKNRLPIGFRIIRVSVIPDVRKPHRKKVRKARS